MSTCIVCGSPTPGGGGRGGFSLCRKHCDAVDAVLKKREEMTDAMRRNAEFLRFQREYPEIDVTDKVKS